MHCEDFRTVINIQQATGTVSNTWSKIVSWNINAIVTVLGLQFLLGIPMFYEVLRTASELPPILSIFSSIYISSPQ